MLRTVDTLPKAERDEIMPCEGYGNGPSHGRRRVYTAADSHPVIVLTEMADNPRTSITNQAERTHYPARRQIGSPGN